MKETVRSIKMYLILVAVIGLILNSQVLTASPTNPLLLIIGLIGMAFSLAFLYMGIRLRPLLVKSPKLIKNILLGSIIYQFIIFLLKLLNGFDPSSVIQLGGAILIISYVIKNVERLSQEEKSKDRPEESAGN
jgi:hypothetical protein